MRAVYAAYAAAAANDDDDLDGKNFDVTDAISTANNGGGSNNNKSKRFQEPVRPGSLLPEQRAVSANCTVIHSTRIQSISIQHAIRELSVLHIARLCSTLCCASARHSHAASCTGGKLLVLDSRHC